MRSDHKSQVGVTDNSDRRLLPYLTAPVRFEITRRKYVLLVPNAALRWTPAVEQIKPQFRVASQQQDGGAEPAKGGVVWMYDGGFVRPVNVETGSTDGVMTEVCLGGLTEGTSIVTGIEEGRQPKTRARTKQATHS